MIEEWRTIEDFPMYEVSNHGRVYSHNYGGLYLKARLDQDGYLVLVLYNKGKRAYSHIHTLVLKAFLGKRPNKLQCNHKDGNKINNHLSNLEWVTAKKNINHAWQLGLSKAILIKEDIFMLKDIYSCGNWLQKELAVLFEIAPCHVNNIINDRKWSHI